MRYADYLAAIKQLRKALEELLELGRKDTSNPKYDGYYAKARKALEATSQ